MTTSSSAAPLRYEVQFVVCVDRPECRDGSFLPVKPGTRLPQTWCYPRQGEAARVGDSLLSGEWDFGSEYIASVQVVAQYAGRSPRTVRILRRRDGRDCGWYADSDSAKLAVDAEGKRLRRTA